MTESLEEKDNLLLMLNEMNEQLEELEFLLKSSFSDLRSEWFSNEVGRLAAANQRISALENSKVKHTRKNVDEYNYIIGNKSTSALKFKLGF